MKMLFYINVLGGGGAERVMANLSSQFSEDGNEVVLVATYKVDKEYEVSKGVRKVYLEKQGSYSSNRIIRNVQRIFKLRKIIKREKPDVVISFMAEPNFRAILANSGLKSKTIVSVRNDPSKEYSGKIGGLIATRLLPKANGCVFQTNDAMRYFSNVLQKKSKVIYNAVKEDFYHVERNPQEGRIVTLGRLTSQKNHTLLIEAFSMIAEQFPNTIIEIYGEGDLRSQIEKQISELQLENRVFLKGNVSNVAQVYEAADVFVLSSDFEGMPNALMEAMAAGLPCVSTDCPCGGPKMLISDQNDGLLVPVGDVRKMTEALTLLMENREFKLELGEKAKLKALEFASEKIFLEWKKFIEGVVRS